MQVSASKASGKKELDHIRIYPSENGGQLIEHHFDSATGPYHPPEPYVFSKTEGKKAVAHIKKHGKISD